MPKRQQPTTFSAGKPINLLGTAYAAGAAIPNAVVKTVRHLNVYLSRRWIVPNVDPFARKAPSKLLTTRPTDLSPGEIRGL